ncbi:hypothetical protein, partial [uncultured Duncaniella sp.]|uniref:hypothetical protein n=1 Tax=uncultured Duncaniella sp. TaxID=2768039 RepID=UPI0026F2393C
TKKEGVIMSMSEKIRITLVKRKISITELASSLGTSQSNLSNIPNTRNKHHLFHSAYKLSIKVPL